MFLLWLWQLPRCGDGTPASVSPPAEGKSNPTNTPVFPPGSFILPSFAWVYKFFSSGQVLLSTLSWCSPCTSVSEGVVLMYPWGEVYSTPTYANLFSPEVPWFWSQVAVNLAILNPVFFSSRGNNRNPVFSEELDTSLVFKIFKPN